MHAPPSACCRSRRWLGGCDGVSAPASCRTNRCTKRRRREAWKALELFFMRGSPLALAAEPAAASLQAMGTLSAWSRRSS